MGEQIQRSVTRHHLRLTVFAREVEGRMYRYYVLERNISAPGASGWIEVCRLAPDDVAPLLALFDDVLQTLESEAGE